MIMRVSNNYVQGLDLSIHLNVTQHCLEEPVIVLLELLLAQDNGLPLPHRALRGSWLARAAASPEPRPGSKGPPGR